MFRREEKEKLGKHRGLFFAMDAFALLATLICSVLLIGSYFAKTINPNNISIFSVIGLISPILYLVEILLFLYWVIRWKVYSLFVLLILISGANNISLFYKPNFGKDYPKQISRNSELRVMSYNVCGFLDSYTLDNKMDQMLDLINEQDPDILCIQEFQTTNINSIDKIESALKALPYNRIKYVTLNSNQTTGVGLAVYSKYPIVNSLGIEFPDSQNSAMWTDIKIDKDTLRMFNIHLQSTNVSREDQEFITSKEQLKNDPEYTQTRFRAIASKLRSNAKQRANQADSLAYHIDKSPHPIILCGDFNDTPMSYCYTTVKGELNDSFEQIGEGLSSTFQGLFNMFRIDYILYSESLEAIKYSNPDIKISDHSPVIVSFSRKR